MKKKEIKKRSQKTEKYLKLNSVNFGLAWGIVTSLCVIITLIFTKFGYAVLAGRIILSIYGFFGASLSIIGIILAGIYSGIDVFFISLIFALIYNKLNK